MLKQFTHFYKNAALFSGAQKQFRFGATNQPNVFLPKKTIVKRGDGFSDLILETLEEDQIFLLYRAKPVFNIEFKKFLEIAKKCAAMSVETSIGREVFKEEYNNTNIIIYEFTGPKCPMVAADPVNSKIFLNADCLRESKLYTKAMIASYFFRSDIHSYVHLLQYSSEEVLSSEKEISDVYKDFKREGELAVGNFADRLYGAAHAHYIELLHFYQLYKLKRPFSSHQNKEFFRYMDEGSVDRAFAYVLHYLLAHPGYNFNLPFLKDIYSHGYERNQKLDIRERELEGAKEIMKQFAKIRKISNESPNLLSGNIFLFDAMSEFNNLSKNIFFDVMDGTTEKKPRSKVSWQN